MKHFLSIEKLTRAEILDLLESARGYKATRGKSDSRPLQGQIWALLFNKPSTRTRVSFEVGVREFGAGVMFLSQGDIQLGRGERIRDTARVLGRMVHGAVIRTFAQNDVEEFARYSGIPTINALTDEEHPCQIIADLLTIFERRGTLEDLKVCFIGDGDCNVARSWIWAAERLGFELRITAPANYQPSPDFKRQITNPKIYFPTVATEGAAGASVLYTDVWVSMGKEVESAQRLSDLEHFQINRGLLQTAARAPLCCTVFRLTGERKLPKK